MIRLRNFLYNLVFHREQWPHFAYKYPVLVNGVPVIEQWVWKKWTGAEWEYTRMTAEEASNASWMWAIR